MPTRLSVVIPTEELATSPAPWPTDFLTYSHPLTPVPTLSPCRGLPWRHRLLAFWFRRRWRGFLTLRRLLIGENSVIRATTSYGTIFDLPPTDYIPGSVLQEGYYESEVLEALRPFLGSGAVLWDIGANFGLHAVTAAHLHPDTTIHAFEPNPAMVALINHHAQLNGVAVTVQPLALSDRTGSRTLHCMQSGNPGMTTLHAWDQATYDSTCTISAHRADELIAAGRCPAPTVIKLDVEGAEAEVLSGLGVHLSNSALRAIVFEAEAGLEATPQPDHPIAGPLRRAGFTLSPLVRHEKTDHTLINYLASRESSTRA